MDSVIAPRPTLLPELWARVFSFLVRSPPALRHCRADLEDWKDYHQHDLLAVMQVNSVFHHAAAPLLYASPTVSDLESFFYGLDHVSSLRTPKRGLLRMVQRIHLINPIPNIPQALYCRLCFSGIRALVYSDEEEVRDIIQQALGPIIKLGRELDPRKGYEPGQPAKFELAGSSSSSSSPSSSSLPEPPITSLAPDQRLLPSLQYVTVSSANDHDWRTLELVPNPWFQDLMLSARQLLVSLALHADIQIWCQRASYGPYALVRNSSDTGRVPRVGTLIQHLELTSCHTYPTIIEGITNRIAFFSSDQDECEDDLDESDVSEGYSAEYEHNSGLTGFTFSDAIAGLFNMIMEPECAQMVHHPDTKVIIEGVMDWDLDYEWAEMRYAEGEKGSPRHFENARESSELEESEDEMKEVWQAGRMEEIQDQVDVSVSEVWRGKIQVVRAKDMGCCQGCGR